MSVFENTKKVRKHKVLEELINRSIPVDRCHNMLSYCEQYGRYSHTITDYKGVIDEKCDEYKKTFVCPNNIIIKKYIDRKINISKTNTLDEFKIEDEFTTYYKLEHINIEEFCDKFIKEHEDLLNNLKNDSVRTILNIYPNALKQNLHEEIVCVSSLNIEDLYCSRNILDNLCRELRDKMTMLYFKEDKKSNNHGYRLYCNVKCDDKGSMVLKLNIEMLELTYAN